ncbi:MAG: ABC transporter substrate-binding protein [Saprospiraceae bacterium]
MTKYIDQLGRAITLSHPPKRIISLVPSITELLYDLGLREQLIGRTKFCVHPKKELKTVPKIGGTKNVNIDRVIALQPDLIIANKEENDKSQIEQLSQHFPVWISDIANFSEAMEMINALGIILGKKIATQQIIKDSKDLLQELKSKKKRKVAYLIWQKPYMTIGRDTYIHDMLYHAGYENIFGEQTRYPSFTLEALQVRQPTIIFLSSEPFPFKQKHIDELALIFPNTPIQLVDGEAFSWYGTRFLKTFDYLKYLTTI